MHLDTVFTQVDYDKFTVHPGIVGPLEVYALTKDPENDGQLLVTEEVDTLENILKKYLDRDIKLIKCGGGDENNRLLENNGMMVQIHLLLLLEKL